MGKMHIITFDIQKLAALAKHAMDAPEHSYGYDILFLPQYHRGGTVVKKDDGWPDKDNIDKSKLTPALILVKDQGIYFMSNGVPALPRAEGDSHVVYANECNPHAMPFEEWYQAGRTIMGGDDTVMTLFDWPILVLKAQADGATAIQVKVTPKSVQIAPWWPKERAAPRPRGG
jgi:hypothetical protein